MILYQGKPKLGLVIGTHGSPAYTHLHLKTARLLYPDVPVLVHDDGSDEAAALDGLCGEFGAEFSFNVRRLGHYRGDLSAFMAGLRWAKRSGVELLVKMSRRWLPLRDWREELTQLALEGQFATFSSYCDECHFLFRTECVAMHVGAWHETWRDYWRVCHFKEEVGVLEAYVHHLAKRVHKQVSDTPGSYVYWPLLGTSRFRRTPDVLWHSANATADYAARAAELGLDYPEGAYFC